MKNRKEMLFTKFGITPKSNSLSTNETFSKPTKNSIPFSPHVNPNECHSQRHLHNKIDSSIPKHALQQCITDQLGCEVNFSEGKAPEVDDVHSDNDVQLESDDKESDSEDVEEETDDEVEFQEAQPDENFVNICNNNNEDVPDPECQEDDDFISENNANVEHPNDQCNCLMH